MTAPEPSGVELVRAAYAAVAHQSDTDPVPEGMSATARMVYALTFPIRCGHVQGSHNKADVFNDMIRALVGEEGYEEFKRLYDDDPDEWEGVFAE